LGVVGAYLAGEGSLKALADLRPTGPDTNATTEQSLLFRQPYETGSVEAGVNLRPTLFVSVFRSITQADRAVTSTRTALEDGRVFRNRDSQHEPVRTGYVLTDVTRLLTHTMQKDAGSLVRVTTRHDGN
jgi:hypothetical protein